MIVLGIETSCDETAAAVVRDDGAVLAERLLSQVDAHRPYGGVVPEIAARAHLDHIDRLISEAMGEAGLAFSSLDGVAAIGGPGLIGGVIVGVMTGKAIAAVTGRPFLAINHLEGHALSARLAAAAPFPYLLLLVSGGHCQLLAVEAAARRGNPARFPLPRPLLGRPGCDFSFSGLKTAMRQHVETLGDSLDAQAVADLAAGFQAAVADVLADRTTRALAAFKESHPDGNTLVVAGGVAANLSLRVRLEAVATAQGFRFLAPPQRLCTDNAAMIAWAGIERLKLGLTTPLDFAPRPRWPLDPSAPTARGAGIKA